jgi:hypothetical protein
MAKIAGRKNNAAWQGANNWLLRATSDMLSSLSAALEADTDVGNAQAAIQAAYTGLGIPVPSELQSVTTWISYLVDHGFPLDVWIGKASYDIYQKTGTGDDATYTPQMGPALAKAAETIRWLVKMYQFAQTQQRWFSQDTPPPPTARAIKQMSKAQLDAYVKARRAEIDAALPAARERMAAAKLVKPADKRQKKRLTR